MDRPSPLPPRSVDDIARMPSSVKDLHGPRQGVVRLPLRVAWSGKLSYDLDNPSERLSLYALLLAQAPSKDLRELVNADLLAELWPRLRRLVSPAQRQAWDDLLSYNAPGSGATPEGPSSLPPRFATYAQRLPQALADLRGPDSGMVELPLHVAWSGKRAYTSMITRSAFLYMPCCSPRPRPPTWSSSSTRTCCSGCGHGCVTCSGPDSSARGKN